jgi:predicted SAM-dependent methyltransferase
VQNNKRILNCGAGQSTYGTDRLDFIETPTTTLVCDLEKGIPFPNETFDIVYSQSFLEHLTNVGFHLKECYRVLKKDGKIIIITDNAECKKHYITGTHTGAYSKNNGMDKHYSIYTKEHLKNHLLFAGFKKISLLYIETNYWTKWIDKILSKWYGLPRIKVEAVK